MTIRKIKIQEEAHFKIMHALQENPDLTQRELAQKMGISIGSLNYCLKALIDKGLVKMVNLQKSKNKFKYIYLLTPRGVAAKVVMSTHFLKRKMEEYELLKTEIEVLMAEVKEQRSRSYEGKEEIISVEDSYKYAKI